MENYDSCVCIIVVCVCVCVCLQNLTEENHDSNSNGRKRALEESSSFFSWFSEESTLEEPGEIIRDDIWPNPLQFYLVRTCDIQCVPTIFFCP